MITTEYAREVDTEIQSKCRNFFETNHVGLFIIGADSRLIHANTQARTIFGFPENEAIAGRPLSQLELFFSRPVTERIERLMIDDGAFKIPCFPGTNLAGHFAHYSLSCNRAADGEGNLIGVFGIIEDVTEQVKGRQELKGRIDELSILSQVSQAAASATDPREVLKVILTGVTARQGLGFNRAFLFLLDDNGEALTGRLAIGPSNAEEAGKIWSSLENDERTLFETLSIYQEESERADRSLTDLVREVRIDINGDSLIAAAFREMRSVVIDDATELDRPTDRVLHQLGEKRVAMTPLIFRNRPIGLLIVDNAITHEEITDHDCRFLKLIADQTAAAVERSYLYRDLKERAAELEETNRRLAETQNQIIEAEKMSVIGEITSAVAHELRNPLTIIGGFANLMHKNLDAMSTDAEYLNIIISETQRAEAVLTDVLDFSKASKTEDRCLNLNDLVAKALDMLCVRKGNGCGRIERTLAAEELRLWGNPDQLLHACYQIFWTLMEELPAEIVPRVNTFALPGINRLEICCSGPDRHREAVDKVIRQYFGAAKNTKRLSLVVAEETLKHHGGMLGVESNPEEGPVLSIQLPLYKERTDGQAADSR